MILKFSELISEDGLCLGGAGFFVCGCSLQQILCTLLLSAGLQTTWVSASSRQINPFLFSSIFMAHKILTSLGPHLCIFDQNKIFKSSGNLRTWLQYLKNFPYVVMKIYLYTKRLLQLLLLWHMLYVVVVVIDKRLPLGYPRKKNVHKFFF